MRSYRALDQANEPQPQMSLNWDYV